MSLQCSFVPDWVARSTTWSIGQNPVRVIPGRRLCETLVIDSHANLIRSDGPRIAAIGVDDLVIIATANSVLVAKLSEAQRVREAAQWFERKARDGGKASDRE